LEPQYETINENGDLVDENDEKVINKFAVEKYEKDKS
jgi:hypothetical protein